MRCCGIAGKVSGAWVFKDTRMPAATVFENLEAGLNVDEVMEELSVTREQINAVFHFAAKNFIVRLTAQGDQSNFFPNVRRPFRSFRKKLKEELG